MYTGKLIEADDIRAEGQVEERLKNARAMLAEGLSDDLVQKITGLSDDEIKQLKN